MKKCKRILSVRNNSTPKNTGTLLCAFLNSGLIPVLFILILFLQVYSCGSPGGGGGGGGGGEISFDTPVINPFNLANVFLGAFPCFVDINNDGDLDAFIGEFQGNLIYFENTGNAGSPGFGAPSTNPFNLADAGSFAAPDFVDINNDGDLDAFVGNEDGNIVYFENTGNAGSPDFGTPSTNPFNLADVGEYATPSFVDINNDGDLDAFIGESGGNIIYFENTGDAGSPSFALPSTNPFSLADVGNFSVPEFVDIDNDGDPDVFVGEDFGDTYYFENILY